MTVWSVCNIMCTEIHELLANVDQRHFLEYCAMCIPVFSCKYRSIYHWPNLFSPQDYSPPTLPQQIVT